MPSFSIEAEGETNPLSVQSVLRVLSSTSGSNANQQSLQTATQQLGNWEKVPGYYSLLQDVYSDFSLGDEVRFQAIIQLKNGVDKYWRKTSTHAINKNEKEKIRSQAIEIGIREPRQMLALQNALMLSKVVRYEFPHDWPDVIMTIIQRLRSASTLQDEPIYVFNILNITLQIIKELASGQLPRTRKNLQSVAPELLSTLGQLYVNLVERWSTSNGDRTKDMTNSYSALKTLRRLLIAGFERPHRDEVVKQFWELLKKHWQRIWDIWKQDQQNVDGALLVKHLFQYDKLYLDMARVHPAAFVLMGSMDILNRSWSLISSTDAKAAMSANLDWNVRRSGDSTSTESPMERIALKSLLLFRACVKMVFNPAQTFRYQHPEDKVDRKAAVEQIRSTVFTNDFVVQLMEILVTQYFVLRPRDLQDWEEDPDEWEKREDEIADAWEFSIRSASERLFLDLVINFKELLVPKLLKVFQQYATLENRNVLLKDSIYSAIGLSAACIEDVYNFNTLIKTVLVPEIRFNDPNYKLIRRRIAIMLGQWTPIQPETLDRKAIYEIFTFLLSPEDRLNDHVVRVTAGRQLRNVLEPFEFKFEDFQPYATPMLENVMRLVAETELSETKMALLETVRVAVTKLEGHVEPYAPAIMSVLPSLWTESGEENLMKQAILTMISAIVTSLGQKGVMFHNSVLPVIRDATVPDSTAIVYLLDEALELWTAILQQTPTSDPLPSQELLSLKHSLLPLLEMGSGHLRQCFELLESYTILSPATILDSSVLTPLLITMKDLLNMLTSSRARDASLAPHVLENLFSTIAIPTFFNDITRTQATQHLVKSMIDTGYLGELLRMLHEAYDYHQDPRPNRKPPDVIGVGETSLFNLLARLAILNPEVFLQALKATGNSLNWLVPEWIGHMDSIGDTIRKKLQVMGLTNLMVASTPPPTVMLESLESLMSVWTDLIVELADGAADESQGDYLWAGPDPTLPDWPEEAPENARERAVANHDPTYCFNIRTYIADRFQRVIGACGGPVNFEQEWFSRVDSTVSKAFLELKLL